MTKSDISDHPTDILYHNSIDDHISNDTSMILFLSIISNIHKAPLDFFLFLFYSHQLK
jgi:hypothetical protein